MPPPATPRYRFPSPDDIPRPRSGPATFTLSTNRRQPGTSPAPVKPQFATPAPLNPRRRDGNDENSGNFASSQTPTNLKSRNRGFSPDPDFFTLAPKLPIQPPVGGVTKDVTKNKRRRSFDLDEIDEALISGKPKVLGPSSGGWRYPNELFSGTPLQGIEGQSTQVPGNLCVQATPTPSAKYRPLFLQSSAILSSPPENLNLSFGDTQEDVQEDSGAEEGKGPGRKERVRRRKKRKSVGVFDDIESIASSLPHGIDIDDDDDDDETELGSKKDIRIKEGEEQVEDQTERNDENEKTTQPKHKENRAPRRTKAALLRDPLTPPKLHGNFISNFTGDGDVLGTMSTIPGKQWITVPNQPQINLPHKSPNAKLNKAICAMAWSPSHRKRRNANSKYLTGGLAATVLGWAYDAQDLVLRNNTIIEQTPHLHKGVHVVDVQKIWEEENYVAVAGAAELHKFDVEEGTPVGTAAGDGNRKWQVILIGDENSTLRKDLRAGSRVEVRPPTWEIAIRDGELWKVAINWSIKGKDLADE